MSLDLAHFEMGVQSLGPGKRSVVWVQGCPFSCAGCLAPDWQAFTGGRRVPVDQLAQVLLADPTITGLTFSGGEPMAQAAALARLAEHARTIRDLDIISFTGYTYDRLRTHPPNPGVPALLSQVDVLIDGLYIAAQNTGRGLRGSANQQFHYLTARLSSVNFDTLPRNLEISIQDRHIVFVGIPSQNMVQTIEQEIAPYLAV